MRFPSLSLDDWVLVVIPQAADQRARRIVAPAPEELNFLSPTLNFLVQFVEDISRVLAAAPFL